MILTSKHREGFLHLLKEAHKKRDKIKARLRIDSEKKEFAAWDEAELFLIDEKIKLIEKSLINNDIDF